MPTAIILAGPNGAGKTTFASRFLHRAGGRFVFVNPDEIARDLGGQPGPERDMKAGRVVLETLDQLVREGREFVVETTLSTKLYARRALAWREQGYRTALIYVRLPSAAASVARVAGRVVEGGHGVAEADLLRRYGRSVFNLETVYKPVVDEWQVWASNDGDFKLLEGSEA